ncbi:MAG: hypothetical protein WD595_04765 [Waddliaceae bacterium]
MRVIYVFLLALFFISPISATEQAVTYDLGGGRFGDKLLGYLHAKWISYQYGIPFLYRPFIYSDLLVMDQKEVLFKANLLMKYKKVIKPTSKSDIDFTSDISALYIIPYFPECLWERNRKKYFCFEINWDDPGFRKEIKSMIKPINPTPSIQLPDDAITVALHIREGGGYDHGKAAQVLPLKLPPEDFYIEQLEKMYAIFQGQPLYVHIFTDSRKPEQIVKKFEHNFAGYNIQFNCRKDENNHYSNVIEDFFEMQRFSCLIRPESNFSITAEILGDFQVVIHPLDFERVNGKVCINEVEIIMKEQP